MELATDCQTRIEWDRTSDHWCAEEGESDSVAEVVNGVVTGTTVLVGN